MFLILIVDPNSACHLLNFELFAARLKAKKMCKEVELILQPENQQIDTKLSLLNWLQIELNEWIYNKIKLKK